MYKVGDFVLIIPAIGRVNPGVCVVEEVSEKTVQIKSLSGGKYLAGVECLKLAEFAQTELYKALEGENE